MLFFWFLIVLSILLAMASELLEKPKLKRMARWIFLGAVILALYKCVVYFSG